MEIKHYLQQAKLQQAITTAAASVRAAPQDIQKRQLFCELLVINGNLERADKQWDTIQEQAPQSAVNIAPLRQLLRAEQARRLCFQEGAVPDSFQELTPAQKLVLQSLIEIRQGEFSQAQLLLSQAQALQPLISGTCNHEPFTDIRDGDDLCAGFMEVLTTQGKYCWVPYEQIAALNFYPPEQPLDLIWRHADMVLHSGLQGEIYIPAIYIHTPQELEAARLGHTTDWDIAPGHPTTGIGQRVFLIGDTSVPIMALSSLTLQEAGV